MTDTEIKYMVEALTADMAELLAKDFGMNITESLDTIYNSDTYAKLSTRETGMYFQSTQYVYSFLKNELATGRSF